MQLTPQFGNKRLHQNPKISPPKKLTTHNPFTMQQFWIKLSRGHLSLDTIPTLVADLKPQTHHNSMLVKKHILLFMLKGQPYPHAFPFLCFFSTLLSTSYKRSANIHTHNGNMGTAVLRNFLGNTVGWW